MWSYSLKPWRHIEVKDPITPTRPTVFGPIPTSDLFVRDRERFIWVVFVSGGKHDWRFPQAVTRSTGFSFLRELVVLEKIGVVLRICFVVVRLREGVPMASPQRILVLGTSTGAGNWPPLAATASCHS